MTPATGYLGFSLASGETLLLPQGTPFQLVRAVEPDSPEMALGVTADTAAPLKLTATRKVALKSQTSSVRRSGGKAPAADLERYRKAVETKGLSVAADELGVNYNTLYYQAKRGGWKLPKSAPRASRAKGDPEKPGALRRCERCEQMTRSDPCQHCGHHWKREK